MKPQNQHIYERLFKKAATDGSFVATGHAGIAGECSGGDLTQRPCRMACPECGSSNIRIDTYKTSVSTKVDTSCLDCEWEETT